MASLYVIVLFVHSYLRWVVLLLLVTVLARCLRREPASGAARSWSASDERWHVALVSAVDLQLTLGLLLYVFLSPFSHAFFAAPGNAMHEPTLRFFGMEHALAMFAAVATVHIGRVRSRKAASLAQRKARVRDSLLIALLVLAVSIPWPFFPYGRPLFRGFS